MDNSINTHRLIPLRLQPSMASTDTIRRSLTSSPSTSLPAVTAKSILRPRPGPVTNLTIFPYTEDEWIEVMEEVRTLHLKRQYKQCSARCTKILESINDPYRVHPLYQIYLSFYAASSLEETSRSLHPNSSTKLPLLRQSLTHYQNAQSHMEYASFSTDPTIVQAVRQTRKNSVSSLSSSVRSSMDSIFSQTSSVSSSASVPSAKICSTAEIPSHNRSLSAPPSNAQPGMAPAPLKITKKVSFSLQPSTVPSDAELDLTDDSTLLSYFPTPPSTTSPLLPPSPPPSPDNITSFLLSRSLLRYRTHLSDLQTQLNYHIRNVANQITALQKSRKAWRSNLPAIFTDFGSDVDGKGADGVGEEEKRKQEVRARIERLRENGWRRERFDGARYKALCERALGESD